ncbi:DNA topoisomerase 2-beta [Tyrophagus putrescentiae]|nr:DNA topoisomerase 2-beta [Tyrophagus putrescentiae]
MTNTPSSTSSFSLRLDKPLTSSSFDRWLQIEYLPSDFKHNENNGQDHARRKWYKRIKFDLNEFLHLFSIAILIIWISSVLIFGIYLSGPCSPLMYHRDQQLAKKVEESTAYRAINNSLASSNTSIRFFSPLASGLYRAHQIFLKRLAQNKKSNYNEIEENLPSCIIMTAYAISNFSLSSLLLFHLFFYIFHIVEFSFIFPWFAIEIAYSSVFVILTFIFDVVLCIISPVRTTELIVTLGNLQFVFGLIFLLNRYNQCLSGKLPQDLSDDVDGLPHRRQQQEQKQQLILYIDASRDSLGHSSNSSSQLGHHSLHRDIPSSRYSFYTFRTARSDDSPPSPVDSYSDSYGRGYRSSPQSSSYFSGSSGSNTGSGNVRFPLSNSAPTLSQVSQVKTLSSAPSTGQFLSSTANPVVIRHPNSCSYDRSHAACTFSLLCYLANGVPVEGCEDNSSMTCCYLNAKGISGALLSGTASESVPSRPSTSTIYRHVYPASGSESTGDGSLNSVSSYRSPVSTYHPAPNSISKYYNPNNDYRTVQSTYQTSDIVAPSAKASLEPSSYVDSNYKIKEGLLAPYESKSPSVSKVDSDYYNNAIRRTRTDGYKSRIIGGQDAYYGEIPWMVHIKITKHQCGGALINEQFVITAAHCIFNAPMRQLNVIIGAHDIEDPRFQDVPPQYFSVSKVILHPNFRFSASHPDRYDIALIKLDKTVAYVSKISREFDSNQHCHVSIAARPPESPMSHEKDSLVVEANHAGKEGLSHLCTLILVEGDSAKALVVSGLGEAGRDRYGVFPLRGKLLNVREATHKQIMENKEINNIIKILGLQFKKVYETEEDLKSLRYGKLMIMTDQDEDGSHIKGLLINFIHHFWPSLLKLNFLEEFITPIVKVTKKSNKNMVKAFYSLPEFQEWKAATPNHHTWDVKYYKGLGTSTSAEGKEYFADLARHRIAFRYGGADDDHHIKLAFSKEMIEERKKWLTGDMEERKRRRELGLPELYLYGKDTRVVTYQDFVNQELVLFSHMDNKRSIPSLVDGLKTSQRKVIFTCFKRNDKKEVKVEQLAALVAKESAYHHGEVSLQATIVNMAQDFVGSNNINLLKPNGQFGTRLTGGKDAASARYIFTMLSPLARKIFPAKDDPLMKYLYDDNLRIEPEYYVPIIPMVLVNGAEGIGTGWSTKIPQLRSARTGRERHFTQVEPNEYVVSGEAVMRSSTSFDITELPIHKWTQPYRDTVLEPMLSLQNGQGAPLLTDVRSNCTDRWAAGIHSAFKLQTTMTTTSMVLFDGDGCLRRFDSPKEIFDAFFPVRMKLYEERKRYYEGLLQAEVLFLDNQVRFIREMNGGIIKMEKVKEATLTRQLIERNYDSDPVKAWKRQYAPEDEAKKKKDGEENDAEEEDSAEKEEEKEEGNEEEEKKVGVCDFNYLLDLPMRRMLLEHAEQLIKTRDDKRAELTKLQQTTPAQHWDADIDDFLATLDEWKRRRAATTMMMLRNCKRRRPPAFHQLGANESSRTLQTDAAEAVATCVASIQTAISTSNDNNKTTNTSQQNNDSDSGGPLDWSSDHHGDNYHHQYVENRAMLNRLELKSTSMMMIFAQRRSWQSGMRMMRSPRQLGRGGGGCRGTEEEMPKMKRVRQGGPTKNKRRNGMPLKLMRMVIQQSVQNTEPVVNRSLSSATGEQPLNGLQRRAKKSHKCLQCDKSFPFASHLNRHQLVHTGIQAYKCPTCSKSFGQKGNLKLHQLIHTRIKAHKCPTCPKSFALKGDLKKHQLVHTGIKAHKCTICSKSFGKKGNLKLHQLTHSDFRPFQCSICEKMFKMKQHLKIIFKECINSKTTLIAVFIQQSLFPFPFFCRHSKV